MSEDITNQMDIPSVRTAVEQAETELLCRLDRTVSVERAQRLAEVECAVQSKF
jgi:hypothetical protein